MKKSLVALAVLGSFAGAASAQSSVTIYGLVDMGLAKGNGGTSTNVGALGTSKAWTLAQASSSRLGFRGTEDLGGGLSAQFQFEHRFFPDTGAQNGTVFWQGRSFVQLTSAAIGSVYLGREYDPTFWVALKSDPFGWDGVGQISSMQFAGYANTNGTNSVRTDNTIGFKSRSFGGLTVQAATGLSETTQRGRNDGINLEYSAGPIYAGVGYARIQGGNRAFLTDDNNLFNVALHYDLGILKLIGYYAQSETNLGRDENHMGMIGATAPVAGGLIKAAYAIQDPAGGNNKIKKFSLGYNYPLSRRTNLYADLGLAKQDGRNPAAGNREFSRNSAYQFGVKHVF
jgi:predicted porin